MKKIVRIVWISALSGLAFLAACCTQNGLTRKERKQLLKEREQVEMELANYEYPSEEIYANHFDVFMTYRNTKYSLENRLDSINYRLGDSIDLGHNVRRRQLLIRIDSLNYLIYNYTPACIYGGPDQMGPGRIRTYSELDEYNEELNKAQAELDALDRGEAYQPEDLQPVIDPKKEAVPLYGAPRRDKPVKQ